MQWHCDTCSTFDGRWLEATALVRPCKMAMMRCPPHRESSCRQWIQSCLARNVLLRSQILKPGKGLELRDDGFASSLTPSCRFPSLYHTWNPYQVVLVLRSGESSLCLLSDFCSYDLDFDLLMQDLHRMSRLPVPVKAKRLSLLPTKFSRSIRLCAAGPGHVTSLFSYAGTSWLTSTEPAR